MRCVKLGIVGIAAVAGTLIATPSLAETWTVDAGPYFVSVERNLCRIGPAYLKSKGPAIPNNTFHRLMIISKGMTSAVYAINCSPVVPNGRAQCLVRDETSTPPPPTVGLGCAGWDQWTITRG
ncbi:hypothetical protein GCM10017653_47610 [Ancylobacter defluvii]|uniref:Uncharacterized protein n=1 Tax=Ancylobacter defluvii TaxID=1282440 RepID=A0A9W6K1W0_9HYPH|nr:hypothetical protein GCM10017653_47610 [Ancylobacter defluvii]